MLGAAEGFPVTLCMPENVSRERKQIVQGYQPGVMSAVIPKGQVSDAQAKKLVAFIKQQK